MPRFLDRQEALGWNGPRVNAGDAAAILYESPWQNPYRLWLQKTKRIPRPAQTDAMRQGLAAEEFVASWYSAQKDGIKGESQAWACHSEFDWIQAKVDFWNAEKCLLAEFKAPTRDDSTDHAEARKGTVPRHYWLQMQHEMAVLEVPQADFVSWRSNEDAVIIPIRFDEGYFREVMLPAYAEFYRRCKEDAWPKPEGSEQNDSEEWAAAAREYIDAKDVERTAKADREVAESYLSRMAVAKTTTGAGIKALWMQYKPRWEAKIQADSEEALQRILTALKPLENKQGVGKISSTSTPPNLILRITDE